MATARETRNTRVLSKSAMIRIRFGIDEPAIDNRISAKISCGIAMMTSTRREISWSTQPPSTAATMPIKLPRVKEISVVASAIPIELRAP